MSDSEQAEAIRQLKKDQLIGSLPTVVRELEARKAEILGQMAYSYDPKFLRECREALGHIDAALDSARKPVAQEPDGLALEAQLQEAFEAHPELPQYTWVKVPKGSEPLAGEFCGRVDIPYVAFHGIPTPGAFAAWVSEGFKDYLDDLAAVLKTTGADTFYYYGFHPVGLVSCGTKVLGLADGSNDFVLRPICYCGPKT